MALLCFSVSLWGQGGGGRCGSFVTVLVSSLFQVLAYDWRAFSRGAHWKVPLDSSRKHGWLANLTIPCNTYHTIRSRGGWHMTGVALDSIEPAQVTMVTTRPPPQCPIQSLPSAKVMLPRLFSSSSYFSSFSNQCCLSTLVNW